MGERATVWTLRNLDSLGEIKRNQQASQKYLRVIILGSIPRKEPKPILSGSHHLPFLFLFLMTHIHCWSISSLHSFRQTGNKHPVLSETHHGTKTALARVIGTFPSLNPVTSSHLISPGLEATLDTAITPQTLTHFLHLATQVENTLHPFGFPPVLLCYLW